MTQVQKQMVDYTTNSATVIVIRRFPTVEIKDKHSSASVFLQGDDAVNFVDEADRLYDSGDMSMAEAYALAAYPYVDLLQDAT